MTKKSRRSRAKQRGTSRTIKSGTQKPVVFSEPAREPKAAVSAASVSSSSTQADRYRYIGPELRRIAIIAGSLIVVIIILTFVLG